MAIYKMIYRDEENPETHALHVFEVYTKADTRTAASQKFEQNAGTRHVVAGPMGPLEEKVVPKDATWVE